MKNLLRLVIVAAAAVAAAASASAPARHDFNKGMNTTASFDRTWSAVIEVFAENGWDIKNLEKDSGLITTDWMSIGTDSPFADCGGAGLAIVEQREVRFNVMVRDRDPGSTITVNSTFRELRRFDDNRGYVDCASTGRVEALVHEQTGDVLSRRQRRAPDPAPAAGSESGACYGNGTCNDGLECEHDLDRCVRAVDDGVD